MAEKAIVVEQLFECPVGELWEAITELSEMKQWFFHNIPSFEPAVGFQVEFPVQSGERTFTHVWKILEVIPERSIKYHWSYKEYEGEGQVTFELYAKGEGSLLRLSNEGLESFPGDIPEFSRESCIAGWNFFIKKNLKEYIGLKKTEK